MKSLRRLLILYKVWEILSYIGFGFCVAGLAGSLLGLPLFGVVKDIYVTKELTLQAYLASKGISYNAIYVYLAIGVLTCLAGGFVSYFTALYAKEVRNQGTPFTRPLVRRLRIVGIVDLCVPVGVGLLCCLAIIIAKACDSNIGSISFSNYFSISYGIALLLLSLFVDYPVEQKELGEVAIKKEDDSLKPEDYIE